MHIVWDEPKRLANLDKHGFDLAEVTEEFLNEARLFPAKLGRIAARRDAQGTANDGRRRNAGNRSNRGYQLSDRE
jgi:uncharacterized DUF497 family protein